MVGELRYVIDASSGVAECRGVPEGSSTTAITVPATVALGGLRYDVVSIADGAFLSASLSEVRVEGELLHMGYMAFNTALERLYMSATVPPTLESYLIIDPADPYSVLTQVPQTRIFVPQASLQAYAAHEWWSQYILIGGTEEHTLAVSTTRVGTLGQAILGQGIVYAAVNHLSVSGPLNSDDIYLIRDSLKNLFTLDLSQAAITTLPSGAFQLCRFSSIVLPSTLRDMGSSAFVGCQNLQELEVPEGVLCADNLVSNCQQLKRLDLPSTLVSAQRVLSAYNFDETQNYECTITCRSFFPPKTGGIAVFTFGTADVRLQVPAVSASAYASAAGWKELSQHATVDAPALISVVGQHELSTDGLPADYRPSLSLIQQGNYGGYGANNTRTLDGLTGKLPINVSVSYDKKKERVAADRQHIDAERAGIENLLNEQNQLAVILAGASEENIDQRLSEFEALLGAPLLSGTVSQEMRLRINAMTAEELEPGTTFLTYSIDDLQLSAVDTVRVVSQLGYVPVPQASLISGTYVSQVTQVVLTAQEGCTIWYTLDGSCPCDEARRQRYTGPISITANTTLRAMAVTADGRESEVVTFTWFISTAIANVQQPERNAARSYDLQGRSRQARAVVPRQVMIVDGRKVLRP